MASPPKKEPKIEQQKPPLERGPDGRFLPRNPLQELSESNRSKNKKRNEQLVIPTPVEIENETRKVIAVVGSLGKKKAFYKAINPVSEEMTKDIEGSRVSSNNVAKRKEKKEQREIKERQQKVVTSLATIEQNSKENISLDKEELKKDEETNKILENILKYTRLETVYMNRLFRQTQKNQNISKNSPRGILPSRNTNNRQLVTTQPTPPPTIIQQNSGSGIGDAVTGGAVGFLGSKIVGRAGAAVGGIGARLLASGISGAVTMGLVGAATAIGAAIAMEMGKYLTDPAEVRKRDKMIDDEKKTVRKAEKDVRKAPTSIDKIFENDPKAKEQYNKLKTTEEKRKFLQGYGISDEETEKLIKSPYASKPDPSGKRIILRGYNPGSSLPKGTQTDLGAITGSSGSVYTPSPQMGSPGYNMPPPINGQTPTNNPTARPVASSNIITDPNISDEGKALLDTIGKYESGGRYNVRQGGEIVSDLSQHPGLRPGKGGISSASGKYQFIKGTWDEAAKALNLKDFSPESQDKAAWWLAQRDYNRRNPGRNLSEDIKSKDPNIQANIAKSLNKTWTSLPGGYDPGLNTPGKSLNDYMATLEANKKKYSEKSMNPNNVENPNLSPGEKTTGSQIVNAEKQLEQLKNMPPQTSSPTIISPNISNVSGGQDGTPFVFPSVRNDDPIIIQAMRTDLRIL